MITLFSLPLPSPPPPCERGVWEEVGGRGGTPVLSIVNAFQKSDLTIMLFLEEFAKQRSEA